MNTELPTMSENLDIKIYIYIYYLIECLNFKLFLVGFARPGGLHFIPKKVSANPTQKKFKVFLVGKPSE